MKTVRNSLRAAAPKVLSSDSPRLLAIAALLTGVAVILFNTLPLFVGAVAKSLGFNNQQLGNLAAIYFAGHTLMAVTAPAWIRRLSWKRVTFLGASAGAVGFWLAAQFEAFLPLAVTLFCVGLCGGTLFVVGMAFAADSNKPARSFAVVFFVQIAMGTALMFVVPQWVTPRWGYSGVAIIYAVLFAVGALVALNFNAVSRVPHVVAVGRRNGFRARPGFGLVGILVLFLGASGFWTFVERLGSASGLPAEFVGNALAGGLLAGMVACLLTGFFDERLGLRGPIVCSCALMLVAFGCLSHEVTPNNYLLNVLLFQFAWVYSGNIMSATVSVYDETGQYGPLIPAAMGIGAVAGPAFIGNLIAESFSPLLVFGAATTLIAVLTFVWVTGKAALRRPSLQSE